MQGEFRERPSLMLLRSGPPVQGWEPRQGPSFGQEVGDCSTLKAPADPSLLHKLADLQT